ncbi:hypothetical protein E4U33_004193 [Claviceps sp. LM78 group G4]|nr:hypothetical protein E4U33_004193 [Claviceps sp. LM78 group G4]
MGRGSLAKRQNYATARANHGTPPPRLSTPPSTISAHGSGRRLWQFTWLHSTHSELVRLANVLVSDSELALECSQLVAPDLSMTCSASQTQLAFALGNSVAPGATAQCQVVPRNLEAIVALPRSPEPTSHAHRPIEQRRREEWPHLVRPL